MSEANQIPFLDLVTPHVELEQELTDSFSPGLAYSRVHRRAHGRRSSKRPSPNSVLSDYMP